MKPAPDSASENRNSGDPYAAWHKKPLANRREMTFDSPMMDRVLAGDRYRSLPYVISVVVFTMRRRLPDVRIFGADPWPMKDIWVAGGITMLLGWWGIPFGPVFSLHALGQLWNGGKDHTREMLADAYGPIEAAAILKRAKRPRVPKAMWLFRLCLLIAAAPFMFIGVAGVITAGQLMEWW